MNTTSPRSIGNARGIFKHTRRIFSAAAGVLVALSAPTTAAPVQLIKTFDKVPDGAYPSGRLLVGLDGALYGTNSQGGTNDHGTIFKVNPNGTGFTVLKQLDSFVTGKYPYSGMVQGPDGTIYGTTAGGGTQGGTIFKIQPDGSGFTVLQQLIYNPHGNGTRASLLLNSGVLYGATYTGGAVGDFGGAIFKMNTNGTGFTVLKSLNYNVHGGNIVTGLSQGPDGVLYGGAQNGGPNSNGTVFKLNPDGTGFTVLRSFVSADGTNPSSPVVGNDGALYGVTENGGTGTMGTLYKMNTDGTGFTVLRNFSWGTGGYSKGGLTKRADGKFFGVTKSGAPSGQPVVYSVNADGSGYAVEAILTTATHGQDPQDTVALGADGTIYGAGYTGGALSFGAVFSTLPAPPAATGKVLSFDGTNDYVRSTNTAGLPTGNADHTVEFWVNYTGGQSGHRHFLWHGTPSSGERVEIYGYDSTTGRLRLHRYSPNDKLTNVTLPLNTWTHLAYVYRGASRTTEIFMNGTLAQTLNFTANLNLTGANLQLGTYDSDPSFSANARMEEVRIWNHARSSAQILSLMNSELLGTESGLGVYYNFNQGDAGNSNTSINTLTDSSASANNGTLVNFALAGATSNWIAPGVPFPNPEIAVEQPAGTGLADGGSRAFGTVAIGGSSSLTFTIANSGAGNLFGLGTTIDGANAGNFSVTASPTAPVVPSGSTTFTVRFAPSSPGAKTAVLHVISNDADEASYDITLTGTGDLLPQTIGFTNPGAKTFGNAAFALAATGGGSGNAVTFSVVSGPATVSGNLLTITGAGSITVRASQAGNANYFAAADVEQTFLAAKAAQSISFTNPGAKTFGDAAFALVATGGGSGNAVTFSVVSGPASVAGNMLAITGAGGITVRASQAGNSDYFAAADVEETFTVVAASQTITFAPLGGKTFGDAPFAVSASGGASGEPVTFSILSGPATISGDTVTSSGAGDVTVRASQAGNADYFAAADVDRTFTVAKGTQAISFTNPGAKTFGDAPFALVATGGASGELVTFSIVSGPVSIAGNTVTITGTGDVTVRASQAGNANYLAAADVEQTFTIGAGVQTITFGPQAGKTFGDEPFTVSATGGDSGEPVLFSVVSGPATIAVNSVTITGAGDVTVRASQAGAGDYAAATPVDQTFTVAKAAQSITFTAPATIGTGDSVTLSATGGASGNAVTFSVFSGPGSLAGNVLSFTGAGTVVVRASQAGDTNYLAAADVDASINVVVNSKPIAADDAGTSTTGTTVLYPLANDSDADGDELTITAVSEASVSIEGRKLIVPAGYAGTFTYTVSDGISSDTANVVVTAGTEVSGATKWSGLLYDGDGAISGGMSVNKSATSRHTASLRIGALSKSVVFSLNTDGEGTATFALGTLTVTRDDATGRLEVSMANGGNTYTGSLRPSSTTATIEQHNIALASLDAAIPGGGYATASVKADGSVAVTAKLPDGRTVSQKTRLSDNGSFVIYAMVRNAQSTGIIGGELVTADLTSTDVTGELAWVMGTQVKGLHTSGVDTILTANGSIFTPTDTLPEGAVTVEASGGNLAATLTESAVATAGAPAASVAFPRWTVKLTRAGVRTGIFAASVKDPARRAVTGSGIYLPKSNSAWGFFPGTSVGGRIELTVP